MKRLIFAVLLLSGCAFAPHVSVHYAPVSTYAPVNTPCPRPMYVAPPQPVYANPYRPVYGVRNPKQYRRY